MIYILVSETFVITI